MAYRHRNDHAESKTYREDPLEVTPMPLKGYLLLCVLWMLALSSCASHSRSIGTTQRFTVGSDPKTVNVGDYDIAVPPHFGYEIRTVPEGAFVLVYMPDSDALLMDASISGQPEKAPAGVRPVTLNGITGMERIWTEDDGSASREG